MALSVFAERKKAVRAADSLASGLISCPAGVETVIKSQLIANGFYAYLTSLAYSSDATAGTNIEFRTYLGGVRMNFPMATRNTQLGNIGAPYPVSPPKPLPSGNTYEIRVFNSGAAAFNCESDGEIAYYDEEIY